MVCAQHTEDVIVALLKTCAREKNLYRGDLVHADILRHRSLEDYPHIGSTLISMYAKCGDLRKAYRVLEELPNRSVASWNALISGYAQEGRCHEALQCFEQMQCEGLSPDTITFICILKACGRTGAIEKGKCIHDEIMTRELLDKDIGLGNALVDMYAKCGVIKRAKDVLESLPIRDVVSWNAIIEGYNLGGQCHEAIRCFEQMQGEKISPDAITFISVLKACANTRLIAKGIHIHHEIVNGGLAEKDIVVGTALVDMYAKCGVLAKAKEVHEALYMRDVVSWNALISGYALEGLAYEALSCFERMQIEGLRPDGVTVLSILKVCSTVGAISKGKQIHNFIVNMKLVKKDIILGNALVFFYAKCGMLDEAQEIMEGLSDRNVVSWSALIAGYEQQEQDHEALKCFEQMCSEGISPDIVIFISMLKACGNIGAIEKGRKIHEEIVNRDLLRQDIVLGTALVDMYAKCGAMTKAQQVLARLPIRDVVSWNTLIARYVEQGQGREAMNCFKKMQSEGVFPNAVTYISILKACSSIGSIDYSRQIHDVIKRSGLLERDIMLGTTLVDMYARFGLLDEAEEVLGGIPVRNVVSWNALIAGYVEHGQAQEAFSCFEQMQSEGISLDAATFISLLKTCGNLGAIEKGRQIHGKILNNGMLEKSLLLNTALIEMYAKCSALDKAAHVLEEFHVRDVVSWSALIIGCAEQRQGYKALEYFERMQAEGLIPDAVTFLCILTACSHSGLFNEAEHIFRDMVGKHDIAPSKEHLTCMVAIFGCTGEFDKLMWIIQAMSSSNYSAVWVAVLGACKKWAHVKLGKLAFDQAIQIDTYCPTAYVLMANIFAAAGLQEDAERMDAMRLKYCSWEKQSNSVWANRAGNAHTFSIRDIKHP